MKMGMRKETLRLRFESLILILIFGDQGISVYLEGVDNKKSRHSSFSVLHFNVSHLLGTVSSVATSLFDFIWCKKLDKVKRQVMYQDYVDGGLCVPNMEVIAKSLKLAWISRFLTTDVLSRKENWKAIPIIF